MENQERPGREGNADSPEEYREGASEAIAGLEPRIVRKIRKSGPISFPEFMEMALYDPEEGYYARRSDQVGRSGDFFTSVSAGPLYGRLLAEHVTDWWRSVGCPAAWRLIELGAHDGTLATDLLSAIRAQAPDAYQGLEYAIIEPLSRLAEAQQSRLTAFAERLRIVSDPSELSVLPGYLVANEVLDALPFHVIEAKENGWHELGVAVDADGHPVWHDLGPTPSLTHQLPVRQPGYRSEVRSGLAAFLEPLAQAVRPGRMLWIDYGFEREDYYDEARSEGTLRTFCDHRAGDDPLADPGARDITAHVDFTALREAVESLGGEVLRFENQSRFLTAVARPWLLSLEGNTKPETMKLLRNFQTLTHPGQMGSRFHLFECGF